MKYFFTLSQPDIDRLKEAGLILDSASVVRAHREKGQDYFNVTFEAREEWDAVFRFLYGEDQAAPDPVEGVLDDGEKIFTFQMKDNKQE
ncbi:MAG: hypothetical protein IJ662_02620 [Clostridia bacterium]|nr:hypothetical protein [Clostridia bacterium]